MDTVPSVFTHSLQLSPINIGECTNVVPTPNTDEYDRDTLLGRIADTPNVRNTVHCIVAPHGDTTVPNGWIFITHTCKTKAELMQLCCNIAYLFTAAQPTNVYDISRVQLSYYSSKATQDLINFTSANQRMTTMAVCHDERLMVSRCPDYHRGKPCDNPLSKACDSLFPEDEISTPLSPAASHPIASYISPNLALVSDSLPPNVLRITPSRRRRFSADDLPKISPAISVAATAGNSPVLTTDQEPFFSTSPDTAAATPPGRNPKRRLRFADDDEFI